MLQALSSPRTQAITWNGLTLRSTPCSPAHHAACLGELPKPQSGRTSHLRWLMQTRSKGMDFVHRQLSASWRLLGREISSAQSLGAAITNVLSCRRNSEAGSAGFRSAVTKVQAANALSGGQLARVRASCLPLICLSLAA